MDIGQLSAMFRNGWPTGVICETRALPGAVIPAKAGIQWEARLINAEQF
jgi:hypothetical protein